MEAWRAYLSPLTKPRVNTLIDGLFCSSTQNTFLKSQPEFVEFLFHSPECYEILRNSIRSEVAMTDQPHLVLRGNTPVAKLISSIYRFYGQSFSFWALGTTLKKVIEDKEPSLEVFPSKIKNEERAAENLRKLLDHTQQIIDYICDNVARIPLEIRTTTKILSEELSKVEKLSEMKLKCVGTGFFLRFICPIIATPFTFGYCEKRDMTTTRIHFLALISQLLQRAAGGTVTKTEQQKGNDQVDGMVYNAMSSLVRRNNEKIYKFYSEFLNVTVPTDTHEITQEGVSKSIILLTSIKLNIDELSKRINDFSSAPDKEDYIKELTTLSLSDMHILKEKLLGSEPAPQLPPYPLENPKIEPQSQSQRPQSEPQSEPQLPQPPQPPPQQGVQPHPPTRPPPQRMNQERQVVNMTSNQKRNHRLPPPPLNK